MRSERWVAPLTRSRDSEDSSRALAPILIIDEDGEAAATVDRIFESVEAVTLCAHTGADGIEMARTWQPFAILVDLGLTNMDAFELARELRLLDGGRAFVVAMAASSAEAAEAVGASGRFDAVINKPVDADELAVLVDQRRASEASRLKQIVVDGGHRLIELRRRNAAGGADRTETFDDSLEAELATLSIERLYLLDTLQHWEDVDLAEALVIGARSSHLVGDWSTRLHELETRLS